MRFKKLRIFVAVTLVLFILVIGNIIAFGLIQNSTSNITSNNANNIQAGVPVYIDRSSITNTANANTANTNSQQQMQTQTQSSTPTPTIVHTRIVSSAS